jgi:hypothetical protein
MFVGCASTVGFQLLTDPAVMARIQIEGCNT